MEGYFLACTPCRFFCMKIFSENCDSVKNNIFPRENRGFQEFHLSKINKKSTKNLQKIDANSELENRGSKIASEFVLGGSWALFGKGLGLSGGSQADQDTPKCAQEVPKKRKKLPKGVHICYQITTLSKNAKHF